MAVAGMFITHSMCKFFSVLHEGGAESGKVPLWLRVVFAARLQGCLEPRTSFHYALYLFAVKRRKLAAFKTCPYSVGLGIKIGEFGRDLLSRRLAEHLEVSREVVFAAVASAYLHGLWWGGLIVTGPRDPKDAR